MLSRLAARPHTPVGIVGAALAGAGLITVAVGTFLPWVRSGTVLRDSYQSISVLRTIKAVDGGPLTLLLDAWTLLIPVSTACLVVYAVGFRRTAATISVVIAIISGTVAGAATVVGGGEEIRLGIASTGPALTFTGAVLTVLGVAGIFAGRRRRATEHSRRATEDTGGEP